MKRRLVFAIGLLLLFGFLGVRVVQAPWIYIETEWQGQYTINISEYNSWGANHTTGEKWTITCQVIGEGTINFFICTQEHYETYVSQAGFVSVTHLRENVRNVTVEKEFNHANRFWIVIEHASGSNVTIDLTVEVYIWQEPLVNIPGSPQYNSLLFLFSGMVGGILLAILGSIYLSLGRRAIKKRAEQAVIVMEMDIGFCIEPITLEGAAYCILFIVSFILGALGISLSTIIQQVQDLAILVIAIAGGAALWGFGIGTIIFAIIHIRKQKHRLNSYLHTKSHHAS